MTGEQESQGTPKEEEIVEESNLTIGFVGRPQVFIEEPRRLPVPLVIQKYTEKPTTVQIFHKQTQWRTEKQIHEYKTTRNRWKFFSWCKRKNKNKGINEDVPKFGRSPREKSIKVEGRQRSGSLPPIATSSHKYHVKKRSASVKPLTTSRYVSVKTYNRKVSVSNRFVNCMYRVCCQFYCYLTCVIVIVVVVVFVL